MHPETTEAPLLDAFFAYARQAVERGDLAPWEQRFIRLHLHLARLSGRPLPHAMTMFRAFATRPPVPIRRTPAQQRGLIHVGEAVEAAIMRAYNAALASGREGISQ